MSVQGPRHEQRQVIRREVVQSALSRRRRHFAVLETGVPWGRRAHEHGHQELAPQPLNMRVSQRVAIGKAKPRVCWPAGTSTPSCTKVGLRRKISSPRHRRKRDTPHVLIQIHASQASTPELVISMVARQLSTTLRGVIQRK